MVHVLVTGASGFLGHHIVRALVAAGHDVVGTYGEHRDRAPSLERLELVQVDLTDDASIEGAFRAAWPEVVIHTAAITDLKSCEVNPERARVVNVAATRKLAKLATAFGSRMFFLSTDQVFDGVTGGCTEETPAKPIHTYGETKLEAEEVLRREHPSPTVVRVALVYGESPTGDRSASEKVLTPLRTGKRPRLFVDEFRSPVLADDVASVLVDILTERDLPLLHLGGPERVSRHEFGVALARAFDLDPDLIDEARLAETDLMPPRPPDVSLSTRRIRAIAPHPPRSLADGLAFLRSHETG